MQVIPIQTSVFPIRGDLLTFMSDHLPSLDEKSVLVVTSKIVALSQGRVVDKQQITKPDLIKKEADYYLPPTSSKYGIMLTIKQAILAVSAGIDESNVINGYVLLPADLMLVAGQIWKFLRKQYRLKEVGVIITDSTTLPLKWGVVGRSLAYCGFAPLKNMIGQPDLHGRLLKMTQMNIAEGLAAAAVLEMGEAAESTPLCLIEEVKHIKFINYIPSSSQIAETIIKPEDDVYAPLLTAVKWQTKKG